MATKSFNQLGRLEVASAANVAARASVADMAVGEVQAFSADGSAPAEGKPFKIIQKTASGFEATGVIKPSKVVRVASYGFVGRVQKEMTVDLTSVTVSPGVSYYVGIRLYNHGSLSPENFYIIDATETAKTSDTAVTLADKLAGLINASITHEGSKYVEVSAAAGVITVKGLEQASDSETKPVDLIDFNITAYGSDDSTPEVLVSVPFVKGIGVGADMADIEYNLRFHNGDQYGTKAFPNQYKTPMYIDPAGEYSVVHLTYNGGREDHVVENQRNEIIIASDNSLASANVNAQVIASINAFLPADKQIADLA